MARYGGLFVLLIGLINFIFSAVLEAYSVYNSYQFYGNVDGWTLTLMIGSSLRPLLFALGLILAGVTLMAVAADRVATGPQETTSDPEVMDD